MTKACEFCDYEDFKHQILTENDNFYVVYPRRPIFKYHLMVVPKKHFGTYDELDSDVAGDLSTVVSQIKSKLSNDRLEGYNMFSNNGSEKIGQHVSHFHLHLFMRYSDEDVSPYAIMSDSSRKKKLSKDEHQEQYQDVRELLS